ncbi:MAG: hypothetical protein JWO59_2496 [Chloroflexi bacterium]|nr:hypothetical protein [Chloroflexota bacterium]
MSAGTRGNWHIQPPVIEGLRDSRVPDTTVPEATEAHPACDSHMRKPWRLLLMASDQPFRVASGPFFMRIHYVGERRNR